jgi:hypothetical protein
VTMQPVAAVKPPPPTTPTVTAPAVRHPAERPRKAATAPTDPSRAGGNKARHRDGLVGDDIFDSPRGK